VVVPQLLDLLIHFLNTGSYGLRLRASSLQDNVVGVVKGGDIGLCDLTPSSLASPFSPAESYNQRNHSQPVIKCDNDNETHTFFPGITNVATEKWQTIAPQKEAG
jgi:hypothetical protein